MKRKYIVLPVTFSLFFIFLPAVAKGVAPEPYPEALDAILYRNGYATSLAKDADKTLGFYLLVDKNGTGRFVDFGTSGSYHLMPNGVPDNWAVRKIQPKSDALWSSLTKEKATKQWGTPHHSSIFDAQGSFNGENNLYHIDLCFDKNDLVWRYRVRGIGITNAKWITVSNGTEVASEQ